MNSSPITGILLAAGASQRFGTDKLTQHLPNGVPVAVQACRRLLMACERILVVVRPGSTRLIDLLAPLGVDIAVCETASQGMGTSLAFAIQSCPDARGWVVALADMPGIQVETLRQVAAALHDGALIAAPHFHGRRGHPVGFSAKLGDALMMLQGDQGAKSVLRTHAQSLTRIDCEDPGILWDIDHPEDLLNLSP